MPCYKPLQAYKTFSGAVRFDRPRGAADAEPLRLPCGQCIGCKLERARQWAVRCTHEASLYDENCMATLTYSDEWLPKGASLVPQDMTKFMKRLRRRIEPRKVRFFGCGEYGDETMRPHYHLLLFGYDFPDKRIICSSKEYPEWTSEILQETWGFGSTLLGSVSFESAAYVARYVTKKVTGPVAAGHYRYAEDHGWVELEPEFGRMSRRPGIGRSWMEQFGNEVYPADAVISRGREAKPPRYYDVMLEESSPLEMWMVKRERELARKPENETEERLGVRERVTTAKLSLKARKL